MNDPQMCAHLQAVDEVKLSDKNICEECVKNNQEWFHLRTCQSCGITLCCDQSQHKHMTKHFHASGHPVIASAQPGERWLWCYPDKAFTEY